MLSPFPSSLRPQLQALSRSTSTQASWCPAARPGLLRARHSRALLLPAEGEGAAPRHLYRVRVGVRARTRVRAGFGLGLGPGLGLGIGIGLGLGLGLGLAAPFCPAGCPPRSEARRRRPRPRTRSRRWGRAGPRDWPRALRGPSCRGGGPPRPVRWEAGGASWGWRRPARR